ncbi:hypothetical protein ONS96_008565 [Cadophora gregata f. sp. sojae]|nr:hypothetical protein ONS96_008565 [Cadophora gregata f. sp. sojae]
MDDHFISLDGAQLYLKNPSSRDLSVFLAIISALFVLLSPVRIWKLRSESLKVVRKRQNLSKLTLSFVYIVLKLVLLLSTILAPEASSRVYLENACISFAAACMLVLLSFLEHVRSIRPSSLILRFLAISVVAHAIQLWLFGYQQPNPGNLGPQLTQICVELALLVSESRSKKSILKPQYQDLSPEKLSSIFGRIFFGWINAVMVKGHGKILTQTDLSDVDRKLSSNSLRRNILLSWDQRAKPEDIRTLPLVLLKCLSKSFTAAILPRICLIIFRYSQTVLISLTIRFVKNPRTDRDSGFRLVLVALFVYVGLAISTAVYKHCLNRLKVIIRGSRVALIYHRALEGESGKHEDGNVVTLLNSDVESIDTVGEMFHETWAQLLEVVVGTALLTRQIGWLSPVPLVLVFCK